MSPVLRTETLRRTSLLLTASLTALDAVYAIPVNGAYRRLDGLEYTRAHRRVVKVAGPTAPVIALPLLATDLLLLAELRGERDFGWVLSSLFCLLANAAITFAVNVPINNEFTRASDDSPPGDWKALRDRWAVAHNARTSVQIAGLSLFLIGIAPSSDSDGYSERYLTEWK